MGWKGLSHQRADGSYNASKWPKQTREDLLDKFSVSATDIDDAQLKKTSSLSQKYHYCHHYIINMNMFTYAYLQSACWSESTSL